MAAIARTLASLRIIGDDLDPNEITKMLGAAPTQAARMGERRAGKSGREIVARTGSWRLEAAEREPGDLDAQLREIFAQVTSDLAVWSELRRHFRCDLFCGLFLDDGNESLDLEPETLGLIAARGLRLCLDIYGPTRASGD